MPDNRAMNQGLGAIPLPLEDSGPLVLADRARPGSPRPRPGRHVPLLQLHRLPVLLVGRADGGDSGPVRRGPARGVGSRPRPLSFALGLSAGRRLAVRSVRPVPTPGRVLAPRRRQRPAHRGVGSPGRPGLRPRPPARARVGLCLDSVHRLGHIRPERAARAVPVPGHDRGAAPRQRLAGRAGGRAAALQPTLALPLLGCSCCGCAGGLSCSGRVRGRVVPGRGGGRGRRLGLAAHMADERGGWYQTDTAHNIVRTISMPACSRGSASLRSSRLDSGSSWRCWPCRASPEPR